MMNDDCDSEKKYLDASKIVSIAEGVITVKYEHALIMCYPTNYTSPVNLPTYSEKGEEYSPVTDIEFDEKFNVISLILGDKQFPVSAILSHSKSLIVFRLPNSTTRLIKSKKKVPLPKTPAPTPSTDTVKITEFQRYSFLIGKPLHEDLFDENNNLICAKDTVIDSSLLDTVKARNLLVQLAMRVL